MTVPEAKLKFQQFIDGIPACIATVKKLLNKETLTYEVEEVKAFEELYERYFRNPALIGLERTYFNHVFEVYIGTAYLWHFGGRWYIDLNKKYDNFGRIYLIEYGGKDYTWVGIGIEGWRESVEEEPGFGIHKIIENNINYFLQSPEYTLEPTRTIN